MLVLLEGKEDVDVIEIKQIGIIIANNFTSVTKAWKGEDERVGAHNVAKFGYIVKENNVEQ